MVSMTLLLMQTSGALLLLLGLARAARWLWLYACLPLHPSGARLAQSYGAGSWALITSAGDGLGRLGFNLILAVNVGTTARVTHALLPLLLRHADTTGRRAALPTEAPSWAAFTDPAPSSMAPARPSWTT